MTNNDIIANRLVRRADTNLRRALRSPAAPMLDEVARNDHADLLAIAGMIRRGDFDIAWQCMNWLDTAARDEIPSSVWNFVERHANRPLTIS